MKTIGDWFSECDPFELSIEKFTPILVSNLAAYIRGDTNGHVVLSSGAECFPQFGRSGSKHSGGGVILQVFMDDSLCPEDVIAEMSLAKKTLVSSPAKGSKKRKTSVAEAVEEDDKLTSILVAAAVEERDLQYVCEDPWAQRLEHQKRVTVRIRAPKL
jgi:hypothetical protein